MQPLFQHLNYGPFSLKNRLMLAAMTRCRGNKDTGAPTDVVATYYAQRAESASVVVTESLPIHPYLNPWPGACSLFTKEAVEGWKKVIDAVHAKNSVIFAQLFHCGRATHADLAAGNPPLAPSAIPLSGTLYVGGEKKPYTPPLEMNLADIQMTKNLYQIAINNAKAAGFDGVEFNSHNGYLLDSFIRSSTNKRKDNYGGSVQNRCRLLLEVVDIAIQFFGPSRVGVKLSPTGRSNDIYDDNPVETLSYLASELSKKDIMYITLREPESYLPEIKGTMQIDNLCKVARPLFKNIIVTNGVSHEEGQRRIRDGEADMWASASAFIANPDLAERIKNGWEIVQAPASSYFGPDAKEYIDWPKYSA